jgi:lipopolysaccharide transport system permease protein
LLKQDINILLVLNLLILFCFQQLFAYSLGLLFGVLNVFFRDIKEFLTIFMNIWFWMTPIVWVPSIAPEWLQKIQENVNIYLWFLSEYREIFLEGNTSSIENFGPLFLIAFLVLSTSLSLIKLLEREIRDAI